MTDHFLQVSLPTMPEFAAFYWAVNQREPFPWQSRLAALVEETEQWPEEISIPTGMGKTACLDIAIWWLASQAHRAPSKRTAPTRIWWIVNRQPLVDSTAVHANRIQHLLANPYTGGRVQPDVDNLQSVAQRLNSVRAGLSRTSLQIIQLYGGLSSSRPTDPSQPAVILSTIPMYGSRLLFSGYGVSRSMRPIDAALAVIDSLVIADETPLASNLVDLLSDLRDCQSTAQSIINEKRSWPIVVGLTATINSNSPKCFTLNREDETDPIIKQRLDASKPVEVQVHTSRESGKLLAEATRSLLSQSTTPASCVVFTNTADVALNVYTRLVNLRLGSDILLLTSRTREREAESTRKKILDPNYGLRAGIDPSSRRKSLIVIATHALEVGSDIDAEFMVTEACGTRALTQRLGRFNRLGNYNSARSIYVHSPPARRARAAMTTLPGWPVYLMEPRDVLKKLQENFDKIDTKRGSINLSSRNTANVLGTPGDHPGRTPAILPGLLWEWVKTTAPPKGAAPVEPYFSGIAKPNPKVSIIWRTHIPGEGQRLWPRASSSECVNIPVSEARNVLKELKEIYRLDLDELILEKIGSNSIRTNDILILSTVSGMFDELGWSADSNEPVLDVSVLNHGIPLDSEAIQRLTGPMRKQTRHLVSSLVKTATGAIDDYADTDDFETRNAVVELVEILREHPPIRVTIDEWEELINDLDHSPVHATNEVSRLERKNPKLEANKSDNYDEVSIADSVAFLDIHNVDVGNCARSVAMSIGIRDELVKTIEMAGRFHDLGKADERFQRWLQPESEVGSPPVAKSSMRPSSWEAARQDAGWPRGGRHESLSARLVYQWLQSHNTGLGQHEVDLLTHLVISHHGKGRPLVPPAEDGTAMSVICAFDRVEVIVPADLSIVDWDQPSRFTRLNQIFGSWGLALMEAIVRQSDHSVSAGYQPITVT